MASNHRIDLLLKMQAEYSQLKAAGKEVRRVKQESLNFGKELKRGLAMGVGFGGIATGAAGAALAIRQVASNTITTNANLEQQQVAFETLLGSAEAAQKRVQDLVKFSAKTPFELEPLLAANKLLQAMGGNTLASAQGMQLVGDTAAAVGRPISDLSMWIGRLYAGLQSGTPVGEATLRLIEMGAITGEAKRKLDEMAKTAHGHAGAMEILKDTFGDFSGAMEKQSRTFNGMMTTLKDNFSLATAEKMKPFFEVIKQGLSGILLQLGIVNPEVAAFTRQLQTQLDGLAAEVKDSSNASIDAVRDKLRAAQAELSSLQKAQEAVAAKGNPKLAIPLFGGPIQVPDLFAFLGDPQGQAEKKIESVKSKILELQELLAVAGDEEALSRLLPKESVIKKLEAHRDRLAQENNGLNPVQEREMERRIEVLEGQLELWNKIEAQKKRTDNIETVLAEEKSAERAKQKEEQRLTIFDAIEKAKEKTAKAEFELLMNADQQIASLEEKKALIEAEMENTKALAQNEDQRNQADLFYRTQIAEIEKEILGIQEEQQEKREKAIKDELKKAEASQKAAEALEESRLRKLERYTESIRKNFANIITGTQTWKQALADIGNRTLSEILMKVQEVFAAWIEGMIQKHIIGQALQKQETAAGVQAAGAQTAAWTPAAFLSSVASFGASLAAGALLMAAVAAISGGFAEGGYTGPGGKFTPAGIVHAGEFVMPKDVVDTVGTDALYDFMNRSRGFATGGAVGPMIPTGTGTGGDGTNNLSVVMVDDNRSDIRRALESTEGRAAIMRTVRGKRNQINF